MSVIAPDKAKAGHTPADRVRPAGEAFLTTHVQAVEVRTQRSLGKTVNNILTALSVMLRTAVDWGAIRAIGLESLFYRSELSECFNIVSNQCFLFSTRPSLQLILPSTRGGVRASSPFLMSSESIIDVVGFTDIERGIGATKHVYEVHDDDDAIVKSMKSRV